MAFGVQNACVEYVQNGRGKKGQTVAGSGRPNTPCNDIVNSEENELRQLWFGGCGKFLTRIPNVAVLWSRKCTKALKSARRLVRLNSKRLTGELTGVEFEYMGF